MRIKYLNQRQNFKKESFTQYLVLEIIPVCDLENVIYLWLICLLALFIYQGVSMKFVFRLLVLYIQIAFIPCSLLLSSYLQYGAPENKSSLLVFKSYLWAVVCFFY